jgi:hypothetical protein
VWGTSAKVVIGSKEAPGTRITGEVSRAQQLQGTRRGLGFQVACPSDPTAHRRGRGHRQGDQLRALMNNGYEARRSQRVAKTSSLADVEEHLRRIVADSAHSLCTEIASRS